MSITILTGAPTTGTATRRDPGTPVSDPSALFDRAMERSGAELSSPAPGTSAADEPGTAADPTDSRADDADSGSTSAALIAALVLPVTPVGAILTTSVSAPAPPELVQTAEHTEGPAPLAGTRSAQSLIAGAPNSPAQQTAATPTGTEQPAGASPAPSPVAAQAPSAAAGPNNAITPRGPAGSPAGSDATPVSPVQVSSVQVSSVQVSSIQSLPGITDGAAATPAGAVVAAPLSSTPATSSTTPAQSASTTSTPATPAGSSADSTTATGAGDGADTGSAGSDTDSGSTPGASKQPTASGDSSLAPAAASASPVPPTGGPQLTGGIEPAATAIDVSGTADTAATVAPVAPVAPAAAPVPAASATATAATPAPAAAALPFTAQVATPLFTLAGAANGEHTLTINVTPDNLGPVTVRAHVSGEHVRIELFAPTDGGRDALRQIMTDLRRDIAASGMTADLGLSSRSQPDADGAHQQNGGRAAAGSPRTTSVESPVVQTVARPRFFGSSSALDVLA